MEAVGYRDDLEAARLRVDALERELRALVPDDGVGSAELDLFELRRRLAATELTLAQERREREHAQSEARGLETARDRLVTLEKALELVQQELQRRRREHEPLWREAALAEIRGRELEVVRARLHEVSESAEREAKRADVAEVALIRTQMRLSVERARAQIRLPWPRPADPAAFVRTTRPSALLAMPEEALRIELERLVLLVADALWNAPGAGEAVSELFDVLRTAGHPLRAHASRRFGPDPPGAPGLTIAIAPLALQITWVGSDRSARVVTIADDVPLSYTVRLG